MSTQIPRVIADLELQLATAISIGDTSFTLASGNDDDGNALPAGIYVFSADSGTSNKEYLLGQLNGVNVTAVKSVSRQGVQTSGAVRKHRVGAPVVLTNFAALQLVADTLRGQINLDGSSPLSYDTLPSLADGKELATVQYVLDTVSGGTVAFDAQIITGTAGETVAEGDLVYFKTSDQEWYKTDADTAATIEGVQLGIAQGAGSDGVGITGGIQIAGTYTTTGLTAGSIYYASNTAGEYGTTAGTTPVVIGIALSTTKILINQPKQTGLTENTFVPIGAIMPFAGSTAPNNYLLAQGQAVSRTTYSGLFAVLGTSYGAGDGSTTFNLPNLQGRVPVGLDSSQTEFDALGETGGAKTHTLTIAEMPSHNHPEEYGTGGFAGSSTSWYQTDGSDTSAYRSTDNIGNTGGDGAHNNLQPYITLNYIVRAL